MSIEVLRAGKLIPNSTGKHITRICPSDELIVVLQGELAMFEEDKQFRVRANEYLLLKRGRRHGGLEPYPHNLLFCWVHFMDDGTVMDHAAQHGRLRKHSAMPTYIQAYISERSALHPDQESLQLLFQLMVREILRPTGDPEPSTLTPLVISARQYLELHFREDISMEKLSHDLHCNGKYLGQLFHRIYGETISAVINRLRIEHARKLLVSGNFSIKEAASASGFNDMAHFRRQFKRICNITPKEFRRQYLLGRWTS